MVEKTLAVFIFLGERQLERSPYRDFTYAMLSKEEFERKEAQVDVSARILHFKSPLATGYSPGALLEFPYVRKEDGALSVYSAKSPFLGHWPIEEQVVQWQLLHHAAQTWASAKRQEDKSKSFEVLAQYLDPIRKLYWNSTHARRAGLLAYILYYITKG